MLHALWSVLIDLWRFLLGRQESADTYALPHAPIPLSLEPRPIAPVLAPAIPRVALNAPEDNTVMPETLSIGPMAESTTNYAQSGTIYYVADKVGTSLYGESHVQFDSLLMRLRFGQSVSLKQFIGQYAEVLVFGVTGFVRKDAITPHIAAVWPVLQANTIYDYDAPETQLIRTHIGDEFLGGELLLPLQPGEYVTVRLLRDQLSVPWPKVRPRLAGTWHMLLRGVTGVQSRVTPVSDSIMEWVADDGEGKIAYVDAVLPDDTLKISAVGLVVTGEYTESVVPTAIWREWRPVFISIR